MLINSPNISGSLKVTGNTTVTGSLTVLGGIIGSLTGSVATASYVEYNNVANKPTLISGSSQVTYSDLTGIPSGIVSGSGQISFNGITDKPTLVSGSSQITYSGLTGIPSGIVSGSSQITYSGLTGIPSGIVSGSAQIVGYNIFATTGSNTFQGSQTVTGSLFISQNLVVAGSSSIQYISSSVVDIADNIITVNAFNPGTRFGGLAVADSGSSPRVSGSLLFDSIKDQWIFIHETPTALTSSIVLMGPETYNDLGNETYLSANRLPKGSGIEHLRDSNITDTGTRVSINSNTEITGSLTVTTSGTINGVTITTNTASQTLTNKTIAAGSNTITGLTNSNLSGTAGITNANLANSTISGISLGSNLATLTIGTGLSGTSYNGSTGVTIANTGVTSISAGSGISVNASTGAVTISNTITNNNQLTNGAGYIAQSTADGRYLMGTTSPSTVNNFTISIGNNGSYSYVQSHSGQPLELNPIGNTVRIAGNIVLHAGNYNSYSPTLTGGGASGTWGISISGNAATASNSSNTNSISNAVGGAYTWTGINYFRSNRNTSSDSPPLQAFSDNGSGAIMSFHRGGYYAVNFGLDSDNVMRIGGWSAAANRWQLDMSGNNWTAGSMRSPIFYDSDNTGYYIDAASTSALYDLTIIGSAHKYLYINPGNGYEAMVRYNGGSGSGWYAGKRTAGGINSTADFHFYAEAAGADVFGITTGGIAVASGDMRAPIFYDSNDTSFYTNPNSTSKLSTLNVNNLNSGNIINVGYTNNGNESIATSSARGIELHNPGGTSYWIGKRAGTWTQPMDVSFYTGIRYHAELSYNGHRFFVNGYDTTEAFSVGNGDANVRVSNILFVSGDSRAPIFYDISDTGYYLNLNGSSYLYSLILSGNSYFRPQTWLQFDGDYGLYWPNNYGAHFSPNGTSSYTQLKLQGSKNSYGGLYDQYSAVNGIMYDSAGNGGVYREANGRWYFYYNLGNDCMGIGTSSTSSTYSLYLNKGIYAPSRIDATIYYDASNTAYYLDPNGGSYLAGSLEIANGYVLTNGVGGAIRMSSAAGGFGGYFQFAQHAVIETTVGGYHVYVLSANGNGVVKYDGAQSWSAHSDRRIKTIHSIMENNLSKLESINPIYYSFNNFNDTTNRIGLIAQEVQEHFPELVATDPKTDNLTLDYTGLIPVLLGAIKELKNEIETLKTQIQ